MNKEQFIDTLQACYFGDRGAFNKIVNEYEELHNKIEISIGILKTWKDFCEVKRKYCVGKDKEHWTYCIEKLEGLEDGLKDSDVDE